VPATTAAVTAAPRSRQGSPGRASARPPRACLDLGAIPTAPCCARAWTREILREWGKAELADAAELVASELVTNSVNACAGLDQAAIRLVLTFDRDELAILVRDDHPDVPMAAQPGADDESGRGLLIVEHLSDRCGWYPLEDAKPAKVTWAVISRAGQAAGDLSAEPHPGAGRAAAAGAIRVLPARHRRPPLVPAGMRGPRTVDPYILARVKVALEHL
jgi:anti-sigma regulatory factor (Ser/Thr protein kinase)